MHYLPVEKIILHYIPTLHSRRLLHTLQRRGLMILVDLTYVPPDAPRTWLPAKIQAAILPFPPPDLPPYPLDHHPPPRAGQFWVLRGTSKTCGGGVFTKL